MGFAEALDFTLRAEGGYVDDPRDRGGATNRGVTQATYDAWRRSRGLAVRDVRLISDGEVRDLYGERFWDAGHCGELPMPLAIAHFDWCVNHGVPGAIKTLQQALAVEADGCYGPKTVDALERCNPETTLKAYQELRRQWYRARAAARPDQAVFLTGWLKRVDRLDTYIEGLT